MVRSSRVSPLQYQNTLRGCRIAPKRIDDNIPQMPSHYSVPVRDAPTGAFVPVPAAGELQPTPACRKPAGRKGLLTLVIGA